MSPSDKVHLINEVADALYTATESWREGDIGGMIAYLLWAIADDSTVMLFEDDPLFELLCNCFPSDHPVWKYAIKE